MFSKCSRFVCLIGDGLVRNGIEVASQRDDLSETQSAAVLQVEFEMGCIVRAAIRQREPQPIYDRPVLGAIEKCNAWPTPACECGAGAKAHRNLARWLLLRLIGSGRLIDFGVHEVLLVFRLVGAFLRL